MSDAPPASPAAADEDTSAPTVTPTDVTTTAVADATPAAQADTTNEAEQAEPAGTPPNADAPEAAASPAEAEAEASGSAAVSGQVTSEDVTTDTVQVEAATADEGVRQRRTGSFAADTKLSDDDDEEEAAHAERLRSLSVDGHRKRETVELSWDNIQFKAKDRLILKGVSGTIRPGGLCAIMGPSGAGKSTMLNILAGRIRNTRTTKVSGTVTANGMKVDPTRFRRRIAYVMQEDALNATQTPREAFQFSARLRLPADTSEAKRNALVEDMIKSLGLSKCADTMIGNVMIPGISGGEKKRTAIGIELISDPDILFLDEPTSGLDSYAAFQVVKILRRLSAGGRTVITTIHQPSSEVFDLFDEALLLTDGRLIYHDKVADLTRYMATVGHQCPEHYNPADFIMFLMQKQSKERTKELADKWTAETKTRHLESGISPAAAAKTPWGPKAPYKKAGVWTQFLLLGQRELRNVIRDKGAMGARIGSTIFLNLLVGLVFQNAACWSDVSFSGNAAADAPTVSGKVNAEFGAVVQMAIGGMFGLSQPTLLQFPVERPVFLREYATGTYGVFAYFTSKLLVEVPLMIFQSALMNVCAYWLVGFNASFWDLTLIIALLGLVAASTSLVVGAISESVTVAMQLTPLLFVPQLLFAGFFIPISQVPVFLRWAQYLCSLKYALNIVVLAEFDHVGGPSSFPANGDLALYQNAVYGCNGDDPGNCAEPTDLAELATYNNALLPRSEIDVNDLGLYLAILAGVFFVFRSLALLFLVRRARQ